MAHSWSSDIFSTSATTDGAAACRCEERKKARYAKETYPGGMSVQVVSLVMDHFIYENILPLTDRQADRQTVII